MTTLIDTSARMPAPQAPATPIESTLEGSCNNKSELRETAAKAGKSETLEQYAKDYPVGPHDQPQSMCPAFGSLRVGLRMRRTATILSGPSHHISMARNAALAMCRLILNHS
jgi:3,8-divinyl chlorophyllide a/chlorophyllide a reductase subunit Y